MEELNCETAFTIPVFGGIPVAESVVVTWIIMAVLLLGSIILVRNPKVENVGKKQVVLETVVGGLYNFFYDLLGRMERVYPISDDRRAVYRRGQYDRSVRSQVSNQGCGRHWCSCTDEYRPIEFSGVHKKASKA